MPVQDFISEYEQAQQAAEQEREAALAAKRSEARAALIAAVRGVGLDAELVPVGELRVNENGVASQRIAHTSWSRELGNKVPGVYLHYLPKNGQMVLINESATNANTGIMLASHGAVVANLERLLLGQLLKEAQDEYQESAAAARDKRVYELSRKLREMPVEAQYQDEVVAIEARLNELAPGRAATWAQLRQDWETRLAAAQAKAAAEAAARAQYLEEAKVFLRAAGAENRHVVGELDALQDQVDGTFGLHPLTYAVVARDAADVVAVGTEQMYVTADTPDADGYFTEVNYVNGLSTRVKVTNVVLIYDAETFQVADGNYVRRLTYARPDEPWAVRGLVYCRTADEATVLARFDELLARAWPVSPARPAELTPQQARAVVDQALQEVLAEDPTLVFDV